MRLLADLDSPDFETRESATESLAAGPRADLAWALFLARSPNLEVGPRLERIVEAHGEFGRKVAALIDREKHSDAAFLEEAARYAPPEVARILERH